MQKCLKAALRLQVAVIFYSFAAAVIAYNLGYWMSWYDFFTGDDEKERQDRNTTFSGQHYLGQLS